mmetsp:Transcript_5725/g.12085  ORF Transcript_5725/g.12085 Transcript_5725/m.12085 type:complete len:250 (+) Transcript_5725:410-1159(+)
MSPERSPPRDPAVLGRPPPLLPVPVHLLQNRSRRREGPRGAGAGPVRRPRAPEHWRGAGEGGGPADGAGRPGGGCLERIRLRPAGGDAAAGPDHLSAASQAARGARSRFLVHRRGSGRRTGGGGYFCRGRRQQRNRRARRNGPALVFKGSPLGSLSRETRPGPAAVARSPPEMASAPSLRFRRQTGLAARYMDVDRCRAPRRRAALGGRTEADILPPFFPSVSGSAARRRLPGAPVDGAAAQGVSPARA